jgi:DhnA family fructose-bisphosphate aldolase class Ia
MDQGRKRRLGRIIREDGRTFVVPMDHGVTVGPVKGIRNMQKIVSQLQKGGVEAVVVHKGIAKPVDDGSTGISIGRNVFQHENPCLMVKALSAIVHEEAHVERALEILGESR